MWDKVIESIYRLYSLTSGKGNRQVDLLDYLVNNVKCMHAQVTNQVCWHSKGLTMDISCTLAGY